MKSLILGKVLSSLAILFVISIAVFLIVRLLPGDAVVVMLGGEGTPEQIEALRAKYNLNEPLTNQYMAWLTNVLHGDWGTSLASRSPVMPLVLERLPRTLLLGLVSTVLALIVAIFLGVVSAAKHNSNTDFSISVGSLVLLSVPEFWMGVLLMLLFAVTIPILPAGGYVKPDTDFGKFLLSMILPVATLTIHNIPPMIRLVRGSMLEVLREDYITLALTKGNSPTRVYFVHALRNSLIPIATTISLLVTSLMAGVIVIEKVFQFPGIGLLLLNAIQARDYPMIQACIMVFAAIVVVINLLTDIVYAAIDPRIRFE